MAKKVIKHWPCQQNQGSGLTTINKDRSKQRPKIRCFWDIDFRSFWDGFWRGFGRPKTSILAGFSETNQRQKLLISWKASRSHQVEEKSGHQRVWVNGRETKETKFQAKLPAGGVGGVQPKTNMLVI